MTRQDDSTATLLVERGDGQGPTHTQQFDVPFESGESILDGLMWIRTHVDDSLAFRFSCISANVCKECVIVIDGKKDYACTTKLKTGETHLAALPNKRRLRDLACDTVPPKERIDKK